ncbi:MAG: 5-formyltetrahydrofolate cyclo-ligase [Actinomycetota bacterium]
MLPRRAPDLPDPRNLIGMTPESLDGPDHDAREEKDSLREEMTRLRASISLPERIRLADLVEETLFGLSEVRSAGTVLLFYSFGTEVATGGMSARLLGSGKRLLLPYLTEDGVMEAAEVRPGESLDPSDYGPSEPRSRVAVDPSAVDLVVAPGLAFDRAGNRLGYGGGHYDRFLARMGRGAVRVGIAFSLQIVRSIPVEPGDERVDIVATDQESFDVRPVQ